MAAIFPQSSQSIFNQWDETIKAAINWLIESLDNVHFSPLSGYISRPEGSDESCRIQSKSNTKEEKIDGKKRKKNRVTNRCRIILLF